MIGAIVLQIILIFLNAVFASAEIAVISMKDGRMKMLAGEGDRRAQRLLALTEQPARFLATIQVAITLAGLLGSAFAADNFAGPFVRLLLDAGLLIPEKILKSVSVFIITLILAYFNLVFGELVPKRLAMKKAESMALGMAGMLSFVSRVSAPLVWLLTISTNGVLILMGINPNEKEEQISEEEIRMLLTEGKEQGTILKEENEMIQNVFEFDDISAEQICTRRKAVISLSLEDSLEVWEQIIKENYHTYYPICQNGHEDIVGVLNTKRYFRLENRSKDKILENAVEKVFFVPETIKANVLFRKMRQLRQYFVVVIDEYGGLSGIVTLHDLTEVLVGDLIEPYEGVKEKEIEKTGEGLWHIKGSADLEEVAERLCIHLPLGKYDTFNGFVCGLIDRVPSDGEQFECGTEEMRIQVHNVENHVVRDATVKLMKKVK